MLYYVYKIARWLALRVSFRTGYKAAAFLADVYYVFAKKDKEKLAENLRVVLKTDDKKIIKRHIRNIFRNFAKYLFDFSRFSALSKDYILSHVKVIGKENVDKALSRGRGAILLTAHIGNWELGGAIMATLGYPFYAIALDHKDKRINDFFLEQRATCNVNIIPLGRQLKTCITVLRQNNLLAIVGDRDFSNSGFEADFFGKPARLPRGPAYFSIKTAAPILPGFLVRTKEDSFELIFENAIEPRQKEDTDSNINYLMRQYIPVLERYVKLYPDQWYAFGRIWDL